MPEALQRICETIDVGLKVPFFHKGEFLVHQLIIKRESTIMGKIAILGIFRPDDIARFSKK